jgi:hypothetical protein
MLLSVMITSHALAQLGITVDGAQHNCSRCESRRAHSGEEHESNRPA